MKTSEIIALLDAKGCHPRKNGSGWSAKCPAHEDRKPSLSVSEGSDGRTLITCHAGCVTEDICESLGIKMADLFVGEAKKKGNGGKIVETYPYSDENGVLVFQVCRFAPKAFKQRRPDPEKPEEWIWNMHEVQRVLFRLPEVIQDIKRGLPIFVCEGEKDVLAMIEHGFSATCNPGGANKWENSYTETLRGADVIVVSDSDAAGAEHGEMVAESLHGAAKRVRVLQLPNVGEHKVKDSYEFFDSGGTKADLIAAVDAAEDWSPAKESIVKKSPHGQAPRFNNELPAVTLPGGKVTITETATNLYNQIADRYQIFVRGKVAVSLCRSMTGELVLEPLNPSAARSLFEKFATFWVWRKGRGSADVKKPTIMPEETARAILDCHVAVDILPGINGLVNCPIILESGNELTVCQKGYNAKTKLLVIRGDRPPEVPLEEAVASLKRLLKDFRFQSESDESRALAGFITPALKMGNLIRGNVPLDVAEANQSQSGKTYRQRLVAAIYGEKPGIVPLKRAGVGGTDESFYEKLVNGRPFVQLDNFRGMLDSPGLESFLTAEKEFPCRIPHCRSIGVDPSRYFIMLTSNGVETTRDLANRSSIIRICKREGFQFPDTLGEISSRQPYYLGCVFSVIREWHRKGKHRTGETNHDFREWCQTLDSIVQNICKMAPLMKGHKFAQERVSSPALTFLRSIAIEAELVDLLDRPLTASQIFQLAEDADVRVPGLKSEYSHDEERAKKVIGTKLASVFKTQPHVEIDGFEITRNLEHKARADGNGGSYQMKTYTFRISTQSCSNRSNRSNPYNGRENCTVFQKDVTLAAGWCGTDKVPFQPNFPASTPGVTNIIERNNEPEIEDTVL